MATDLCAISGNAAVQPLHPRTVCVLARGPHREEPQCPERAGIEPAVLPVGSSGRREHKPVPSAEIQVQREAAVDPVLLEGRAGADGERREGYDGV